MWFLRDAVVLLSRFVVEFPMRAVTGRLCVPEKLLFLVWFRVIFRGAVWAGAVAWAAGCFPCPFQFTASHSLALYMHSWKSSALASIVSSDTRLPCIGIAARRVPVSTRVVHNLTLLTDLPVFFGGRDMGPTLAPASQKSVCFLLDTLISRVHDDACSGKGCSC